jgi:hypothetical protein
VSGNGSGQEPGPTAPKAGPRTAKALRARPGGMVLGVVAMTVAVVAGGVLAGVRLTSHHSATPSSRPPVVRRSPGVHVTATAARSPSPSPPASSSPATASATSPPPRPGVGDVAGTLKGRYSLGGGHATITLVFHQHGRALTGKLDLADLTCNGQPTVHLSFPMTGSVLGSKVRFHPASSSPTVNSTVFVGTVSGNSMVGSVNAPGCGGRGTGSWQVRRTS